jgi:4-hydroxy-L-threonine phosphate dehydrogenase PdxA
MLMTLVGKESKVEIQKALRSLKAQRIPVSGPIVGDTHIFNVMGFMLTESQIITLQDENKLNAHGIREFAKKAEMKTR